MGERPTDSTARLRSTAIKATMTEPTTNPSTAVAVADELPPIDQFPEAATERGFEWTSDQLALPSEHFMLASDIPGLRDSDRKNLVARAQAGDKASIATCKLFTQVFLEMMYRSREQRLKEDSSGRPLYINEHGKETIQSSTKVEGQLVVFKRATENRSRYGVRKGREAQSGPGVPYIGEAAWKRRVEEHNYDLIQRVEFKKPNLDEFAGQFGAVSAMNNDALQKQVHATKVLDDTSGERRKLLGWLRPFLKNPVCKWDGET